MAGERKLGTLYEIHPYDLADLISDTNDILYISDKRGESFATPELIRLGENYYIQSVKYPPVSKTFR